MNQPLPSTAPEEPLGPVRHLRLKAAALLLLTLALIAGSVLYLLYARGAFEPTQSLVLIADDSEGVSVGMDMTFSGFPIGRVRRIALADDGKVHILVDVAERDAHWLRESSVFTLVRGLVGGTTIKAYSGILDDPPLPAGARRPVLSGDAVAEVPQLLASARQLLDNLQQLTDSGSELGAALAELRQLSARLNGPGGALGVLLGSEADVRNVQRTLARSAQLLARLDALAARADRQLLGADGGGAGADGGLVGELRASAAQLNALLRDARQSLVRVDAVLGEAQAVGANVREASTDLGQLRAEVDAALRKVDALASDIQRRWPFAREAEIQLP